MTTLGCIQSSYLPWRGYFDIIRQSDIFVFHDDIQYTKQDWRNRNQLKTPGGLMWITVPVIKETTKGPIDLVEIDNRQNWGLKHWRQIYNNYNKAPYFAEFKDFFEDCFLSTKWEFLYQLNTYLIINICQFLNITTKFLNSRDLNISGHKTDRIVSMCNILEADRYLSGPSAQDYIEANKFDANNINLEYMRYVYPEYQQLYGTFCHYTTIIDPLFNCGPNSETIFGTTNYV